MDATGNTKKGSKMVNAIVNGINRQITESHYTVTTPTRYGVEGVTFHGAWQTEYDAVRFAQSMAQGVPRTAAGPIFPERGNCHPGPMVERVESYLYARNHGKLGAADTIELKK